MTRVAVIGAGAWGTALAAVARANGAEVVLWAFEPEVADQVNAAHRNDTYLPGVELDPAVRATTDLARAAEAEVVLLAVPAQHLRAVGGRLAAHLAPGTPVAICAKGIERDTLALMTEVVAAVLPAVAPAVLSGPTFAIEVAQGLPAAVTLAAADRATGEALVGVLGRPTFRPYLSDDPIGAQVGGAVKNVVAIACGIVAGRRLGDNARAALITRGLAEIVRLGVALGGRPETLMGLSGLGDLTLTCNSTTSRNMSLGVALGRGETLASVLAARASVAEGVHSAEAVCALAARLGVEMPICAAVDAVLDRGADIDAVIDDLLARPFKAEAPVLDRGPGAR